MIPNRFSDELAALTDRGAPQPGNGFLMIPVAAAEPTPMSPLQWMYQKLYEQAQAAQTKPQARDLFAVMN